MLQSPIKLGRKPAEMYKNAPLIELLIELRWEIIPLESVPNGGVDPLFPALEKSFPSYLAEKGFSVYERVIPSQIPIEMVPYSAVHRYRQAANRYPLIQLGPGVLTCNVAPPYEGWDHFSSVINTAIEGIFPGGVCKAGMPSIKTITVRYIDGFTSVHGMKSQYDFIRDHLGMNVGLDAAVLKKFAVAPDASKIGVQHGFEILEPKGALFGLNCSAGTANSKEAVILDTSLRSPEGIKWASTEEMKAWIRSAKGSLKAIFESLISDNLRKIMEPV